MPKQDAQHWYRTKRWARRSRQQLRIAPLCCFCSEKGVVTPAQVADHIVPHKGNSDLFWFGALQSLCWPCHSSTKSQIENKGYHNDIGADGWPVDGRHPVYASDR
jgi:5-methylcytosine-specific restriction enzyme A